MDKGCDIVFETIGELPLLEELLTRTASFSSCGISHLHHLAPTLKLLRLEQPYFAGDVTVVDLVCKFVNLEDFTMKHYNFDSERDDNDESEEDEEAEALGDHEFEDDEEDANSLDGEDDFKEEEPK